MAEERTHNWTAEETRVLIEWRGANQALFTGRKNSAKSGWEEFITVSGLPIMARQAKKKWNNLKEKYKELRDPPAGKAVGAGSVTAATWKWYSAMDAVLQGQHDINPPLVVASATAGVVVNIQASTPSAEEEAREDRGAQARTGRKKRRLSDLLEFLKAQDEEHPPTMWNNWGLPRMESAYKRASTCLGRNVCPDLPLEQPLPCEEEVMEEVEASVMMTEHDYDSTPKPGALDAAAARIQQLEDEIKELTTVLSQLKGSGSGDDLQKQRQKEETHSPIPVVSTSFSVQDPCPSSHPEMGVSQKHKRQSTADSETSSADVLSSIRDEDELFLLSLLPSLKRLNIKKRMEVRMKFQQVLYAAEFED